MPVQEFEDPVHVLVRIEDQVIVYCAFENIQLEPIGPCVLLYGADCCTGTVESAVPCWMRMGGIPLCT
jgi:hypothetical protein